MSEQAASIAQAPSNAAPSENESSEPQERSKGYKRRILHLLEEMFGPSPNAQIQGLLTMRDRVRDSASNEQPTASGNARNKILRLCRPNLAVI